MKILFCILCFIIIQPLTTYASKKSPSYLDSILKQDQKKINCSNILPYMEFWFELQGTAQSFLTLSANVFMSKISQLPNIKRVQELEEEITNIAMALDENEQMLLSTADEIVDNISICIDPKIQDEEVNCDDIVNSINSYLDLNIESQNQLKSFSNDMLKFINQNIFRNISSFKKDILELKALMKDNKDILNIKTHKAIDKLSVCLNN